MQGGVDYALFAAAAGKSSSCLPANGSGAKKRIGFAGTIDNRIYFSMVQCICETFPDYDVVFAGHIYRSYPIWLDGFANLHYIAASYQELPQIIQSFEVAILPFLDGISRRFQQSCFSIWLWENRWLHRTCQTFQGLRHIQK
mgnify:CR=1 FL=1